MKTSNQLAALCAAALALGASSAQAYEAGDLVVRARAINVNPDESSSLISAAGAPVAGSSVGVDDDSTLELDFTYMLTKQWGLELILATTKHEASARGSLAALGKIAEAGVLPPTLTLQYHFAPDADVRPYAGIGVNYTLFYDEEVKGGLDAPGADVDMDNSFGLAAQAGVDVAINKDWFINFDVKYIKIDTTAKFKNTVVGTAEADIDIDPWVIGVGLGTTF